jgi:hypothetical protein
MVDFIRQKKAIVTDEHRKEAEFLRKIWRERKPKMSQEHFGMSHGIGGQSAVSNFLNGVSALSLKAAQGFAEGLKCEIAEFSPRLAAQVEAYSKNRTNREAEAIGMAVLEQQQVSTPHVGQPRGSKMLAALQLLVEAYEGADELTAAQAKPLFAMLFAGADRGKLAPGTIAQRLAELLASSSDENVQHETQTPKGSTWESELDIEEEDKNGSGGTAEERHQRTNGNH